MGITEEIVIGSILFVIGGGILGLSWDSIGWGVGILVVGFGVVVMGGSELDEIEMEVKAIDEIKIELVKTEIVGNDTTRTYRIVKE